MPKTPARILYIHNSADIYGASRSLVRLLKNLDRTRFEPLVQLPEPGPLQSMIEAIGVQVRIEPRVSVITRPVFKSWRILLFILQFPRNVWALRNLIRRERIDLVHTNTGVIVSSALGARLAGVPQVWHIRDWFQEFRPVWFLYEAYIRSCSARVIAVSRAIAGQFTRQENVTVIHNGFSLGEFAVPKAELRRTFRERFGLSADAFVVGCVGRIKLVRKGQEVLVQALGVLRSRGLQPKCLIVGSAFPGNESHVEALREMIRELKLGDQVLFTGEVADARQAYAAFDVSVLPSAQPEPFGGVVMEAMAMGVPVIATNIGGSVDQVAEGETGFLVPPSDPNALADRIETLMRDPTIRARMSEAGPARIERVFSISGMVEQIHDVYQRAIDGRAGGC